MSELSTSPRRARTPAARPTPCTSWPTTTSRSVAVLRDDADLIEGGQGRPVQARTAGRWQTHIGRVFEAAARDHVQRLVGAGQLPPDTVVGRWWRDEAAEIDVLALSADGPAMVGECRWQSKEITERDLAELRRKAVHLPPPSAAGTTYVIEIPERACGRGGLRSAADRVRRP